MNITQLVRVLNCGFKSCRFKSCYSIFIYHYTPYVDLAFSSMGVFTLKIFFFILRDWNVQSYQSIDLTDSFGQDTNIYINQILKIESKFSTTNLWKN